MFTKEAKTWITGGGESRLFRGFMRKTKFISFNTFKLD